MFRDRKHAGEKLAAALEKYSATEALVLAIPRGGVEVGYEVAKRLDLEFSVLVTRKLPFPDQPEAGFGAVAEDGSVYVYEEALKWLDADTVEEVTQYQRKEVNRRVELFRGGLPLPRISSRHVILVDDGIAMGSTVNASIMLLKNKKAGWITVAAPVTGPETAKRMERIADEVVVLDKPASFRAVAEAYQNWYDVSDGEVMEILDKWNKIKGGVR
ncbi:MAG: phosphoribosyltransferase [Candidatus Omnitrophica bacterium]|nr:phosphoribosyltransferase [Candidatus Omnitrophota bacterium]